MEACQLSWFECKEKKKIRLGRFNPDGLYSCKYSCRQKLNGHLFKRCRPKRRSGRMVRDAPSTLVFGLAGLCMKLLLLEK